MSTAYPELTVLSGSGKTDATAGIVASFVVTLYDIGNNKLLIGGDTLLVTISNGVTMIEIFDNEDGSYKVDY